MLVKLLHLLRQLCPGFEGHPLESTAVAVRASRALYPPRLLLRVFEPTVDPTQLALRTEAYGLGDCVAVETVVAVDLDGDAACELLPCNCTYNRSTSFLISFQTFC